MVSSHFEIIVRYLCFISEEAFSSSKKKKFLSLIWSNRKQLLVITRTSETGNVQEQGSRLHSVSTFGGFVLGRFSSSRKVVAANIDVMLEHDAQGKKTKNSPLNGVNQSTST